MTYFRDFKYRKFAVLGLGKKKFCIVPIDAILEMNYNR